MMEATVSLVLVVSAITFVSAQLNASTANLGAQRNVLQRSAALYDVLNTLRRNASSNNCLSLFYLTSQTACIRNLTEAYATVLGLHSLEVRPANAQNLNYTQNATSICMLIFLEEANHTSRVCVVVESG